MIVRIMEEDQFRLDDAHEAEFAQLDQALLTAVQADDQVQFMTTLGDLLTFIHQNGQKVPYTEIVPSDVVVPSDDITLAEAKSLLVSDATTSSTDDASA